ncbi:MAG: hypothetical protein IIA41_14295 [SAR324 cluster bacterium]|nr:hypothetical protein [SAR324 cluster bacterium]
MLNQLVALLKTPQPEDLPARVQALQDELRETRKSLQKQTTQSVAGVVDELIANAEEIDGVTIVTYFLEGANRETLRSLTDQIRQKAKAAAILLATVDNGKVAMTAAVTKDLIQRGVKAGDCIKVAAKVVGGGGGGRRHGDWRGLGPGSEYHPQQHHDRDRSHQRKDSHHQPLHPGEAEGPFGEAQSGFLRFLQRSGGRDHPQVQPVAPLELEIGQNRHNGADVLQIRIGHLLVEHDAHEHLLHPESLLSGYGFTRGGTEARQIQGRAGDGGAGHAHLAALDGGARHEIAAGQQGGESLVNQAFDALLIALQRFHVLRCPHLGQGAGRRAEGNQSGYCQQQHRYLRGVLHRPSGGSFTGWGSAAAAKSDRRSLRCSDPTPVTSPSISGPAASSPRRSTANRASRKLEGCWNSR